jgi:hypothetical protein
VQWIVASLASILALIADGLAGDISTASAGSRVVDVIPVIDAPAPRFWVAAAEVLSGAQASRIELDDADLTATLSAWYRLAYVDGGTRLRVFEHYPTAIANPDTDMVDSETVAWRLANTLAGPSGDYPAFKQLPRWARLRTGNDTGGSGGLMFTLAYIDVLTPGPLVGDLRVTGSGGISPAGTVFPVSSLEVKVAAAMLARPDVVFTTRPPKQVENVTIVEGFNLTGYEQAGRLAAGRPGRSAVVVVHDVRQALAWLCGRTEGTIACAIAHTAVTIPIGTP